MSEFATPDTLVLLDAGDANGQLVGDIIPFSTLFPFQFKLGEK